MKGSSHHVPLQRSIATRLLVAVFSIYLIITVILTSAHMYAEYAKTKNSVLQELAALQQTFNPGLATAIYNVDNEGIESMVLGMVRDPMVVGVTVHTEYQGEFTSGEIPTEDSLFEEPEDLAGGMTQLDAFSVRGTIAYAEPGEDRFSIGMLSLYSSKSVVLSKVWFALAIILVNAVIKTVALWAIFLWFSRRHLVRPLAKLTEATSRVRMEDLEHNKVELETTGRNELRVLADAFNGMIDKLAASRIESESLHQSLAKAKQEVEGYNRSLEERVERRTRELKKAKDAAEKATAIKSVFLANMSHEIRTPMNVVLGMADLLEEAEVDEEKAKLVRILRKSGHELLQLIDDILDLSKVEAGQVQLEHIPFDLMDLVDSACKGEAIKAHAKGVELVSIASPDVPDAVQGDPTRLRQVLANLLSNAMKFTESGEVVLSVERVEKGTFRFTVRDSGIGIAPDKLNAIFDSFAQADSSTTRKYGGTGLGLAICRQLLGLMGSSVEVHSDFGCGAEFSFVVELEEGCNQFPEGPMPQLAPKRILVADDNEQARRALVDPLTAWGGVVLEAESGEQAVELWKQHADSLDMIFLDQQLGDMTGLEVLEKGPAGIRPQTILMIPAPLEEQERETAFAHKVTMLFKPMGLGELRGRMRRG